jgi:hypothetical protein
MHVARAFPMSALLQGGKVLLAGGESALNVYPASADTYDPLAGTFTLTGAMATGRAFGTATPLQQAGTPPAAIGQVLLAGGFNSASNYLATATLFSQDASAFGATGSLVTRRGYHVASLLPDGRVLVAGGTDGSQVLQSVELYDPAAGTFATATGQGLGTPRQFHTATGLQDGRVLVVGGNSGASTLRTAEVWTNLPP